MISEPRKLSLLPRIMELQQALFFNYSEAVLKLPITIVNALAVDELQQVWFAVNRPQQQLCEFDRNFPARLEFYKKGKDFHMHVEGKAHLVIDPEELTEAMILNPNLIGETGSNKLLVRMKIEKLEYFLHAKPARARMETHSTRHPLAFVKTLQYIVKDIIPVLQAH
jgi:hypothetical protein